MASIKNNEKDDYYGMRYINGSRFTGERSTSFSQAKTRSKNKFQKQGMNSISRTPKITKERQYSPVKQSNNINNYGNININVKNLIINNPSNSNNNYQNSYGPSLQQQNSMFSKIGYDIIGRKPRKQVQSQPRGQSKGFNKKNDNSIEKNQVENVIQDLMEVTKEKFNINPPLIGAIGQSENIKLDSELKEINLDKVNEGNFNSIENIENININEEVNRNENLINEENELIKFNSDIWGKFYEMELNYELRQGLTVTVNHIIEMTITNINNNTFSFNLFKVQQLNNAYNKIIKIAFIFLAYLKFIVIDFNYNVSLKSQVKKITNILNGHLISIIDKCILNNKELTLDKLSSEFIDKHNRLIKFHKSKKNPSALLNPISFGANLSKNTEVFVTNIKQLSNSYFKAGYFKPIHNVCFEFFRLIDTYSTLHLCNLIVNNVLLYVTKANLSSNNNSISNKSIIFNPTSLLSLYALNVGNVQPPFLPDTSSDIYTLVLDLDETLVHFFYTPSGGSFLIRPGCFEFLREMSKIFDIAIFTAAMKDYADNILDVLDPEKKLIKYRLYRHHTSISGMSFVKDLSKLGRDLKRVIIIDNLVDNFKLQPNNGLGIKTWLEEMKDNQLSDLGALLKEIIQRRPNDIRTVIKKMKEEINRRTKRNMANPFRNIEIDKYL